MKNIKYLLFTFGFMLCMIPNVKAETLNFTPDDILSFTYCRLDGTCEYQQDLEIKTLKNTNHTYYGTNLNPAHQLYQIEINRQQFNGVNDGDSISFYMYDNRSEFMHCALFTPDSNYIQQNSNSFLPLVTLNNYYCNVNLYGIDGSTTNNCSYEKRFHVTCPYYKNTSYDFDFLQSYYTNGMTSLASNTAFFGISNMYVSRSNSTTLKDIEKNVNDLNNNITSSDTTDSQNQANSFFENFDTNDYGLSDIITMPLQLIRTLTNNSCMPLSLTIPFVDKTFNLPCMSSIYQEYFGNFYTLYQTVIFGFVSYWVIVRIFNLVKDFKNPDHDEIEVLDL